MLLVDYMSYFKMNHVPFASNISTDYLLQTELSNVNMNKMLMVVQNKSFAVLTGEPGSGKSTFLRMLSQKLNPENYLVLYVSMSSATPRWLYSVPLEMMGIKPHLYLNDVRRQFHRELQKQRELTGRQVVMIVDEAHLLGIGNHARKYELLEEIRFLLNSESYDSGSPLALILAGQTELWESLKLDRCKAITQRIMYVCQTLNLRADQVGPYIAKHLLWSGTKDNLFSSEAIEAIAELSGGSPRIINKICTHALNYACLRQKDIVNSETAINAAMNEVIECMLKNK